MGSVVRKAVIVGTQSHLLREVRESLRGVADVAIAAEVGSIERAADVLRQLKPDLVLLVPDGSPGAGVLASKALHEQCPAVRLLVITHRADLDHALSYARIGAFGYLLSENLDALPRYIESVARGIPLVDPRIVNHLLPLFESPFGAAVREVAAVKRVHLVAAGQRRAPRREAVIRLVGEGLQDKEIAQALGMGLGTVRTHLKRHRQVSGPTPRALIGRIDNLLA